MGLLQYHVSLIRRNETTYERIREVYVEHNQRFFPFNRGCCRNYRLMACRTKDALLEEARTPLPGALPELQQSHAPAVREHEGLDSHIYTPPNVRQYGSTDEDAPSTSPTHTVRRFRDVSGSPLPSTEADGITHTDSSRSAYREIAAKTEMYSHDSDARASELTPQ